MIAPPGFQELSPYKPIWVYTRHLPHWRQEGATYFVTFHLKDSLPKAALLEIQKLREEQTNRRQAWTRQSQKSGQKSGQKGEQKGGQKGGQKSGKASSQKSELTEVEADARAEQEAFEKLVFMRVQHWAEKGLGACYFKHLRFRSILHDAILFWHGKRVDVVAFVIMPNHAHIVVRPLGGIALEKWLHSVKRFTALEVNRLRGQAGPIWFQESHDRIVRDLPHLNRCLRYIGRNPVQAGIQNASDTRWLNPELKELGYRFAD